MMTSTNNSFRQARLNGLRGLRVINGSSVVWCLLLILNAASATAVAASAAAGPVTGLVITQDGQRIVSVSQHGLQVQRFGDLAVLRQQPPACLQLHDVQLNADNTRLAVVGGNPAEHGLVEVYSWPGLELLWSQQFSGDVFYSCSFHAAKPLLAVAGHDRQVMSLDAETGKPISVLNGHSRPVTSVAFAPGTQLLLSSSLDQTIRVWQADTGDIVRSLNNHTGKVRHVVVFAGNEQQQPLLASGGDDRTVRFWQPAIGRMLRFRRLSAAVTALDWTPSGQHAIAATADGQVLSIDRDTLQTQPLHQSPGLTVPCLSVHPDGDAVIIGTSQGHLQRVDLRR